MKYKQLWVSKRALDIFALILCCTLVMPASAASLTRETSVNPIQVKVFVGAMFEIGKNTGDKAGEFQYWYQRYFKRSQALSIRGASAPVYCNDDGVCGAVLGMGKVASSASMQAILLNPQLDFSQSYFILSGVAGIPPRVGTIGDVSWATWLVDYDLGHRWSPNEGPPGAAVFQPRKGYESIRVYQLNGALVQRAHQLSAPVRLASSASADAYRQRYAHKQATRQPRLLLGTHVTGDTFFHGPGLSLEAQYITQLYGADVYTMTEMEATAIAQVINRLHGTERILSLRGAVNFDQGNARETTLEHLDPAPGNTAGGFDITLQNIVAVGAKVVDAIVSDWPSWQH